MLRIKTKNTVIDILDKMNQIFQNISDCKQEKCLEIIEECYISIIQMKSCLEKELDEENQIIEMLQLLEMGLSELQRGEIDIIKIKKIRSKLVELKNRTEKINSKYQIVFFPYKAEMWDSLESIWLACRKDERCDCKVVPIPYYHFNSSLNEWIYCYEIEQFPKDVPVIDYRDFSLEDNPDVGFIHNPYDQYNHVTHVHSDYYSWNLKNHVGKLFYVPYYVTSGLVSERQTKLSAYVHADYIIVQSEKFKMGLEKVGFGKKVVVMGNPKYDRILNRSKDAQVVEEWKSLLDNKKSVMLNTSLNRFLYDGEAYLKKLKYVFRCVSQRDDIVLIWRPHPLLKSTIESMRPWLLKDFLGLEEFYINNNIGILDKTPDVFNSIAAADAYIGEVSSSVINLFALARKPLFLLNNYWVEKPTLKEQCRATLLDAIKCGNKYYVTLERHNGLFQLEDENWSEITLVSEIETQPKWLSVCSSIEQKDKTLYLTPLISSQAVKYDIEKTQMVFLGERSYRTLAYKYNVVFEDKVYYLTKDTNSIIEFDCLHKKWCEYTEPIKEIKKGYDGIEADDVADFIKIGRCLWITTGYSNKVLCFDMKSYNYTIYCIGSENCKYSAITADEQNLYLSEVETGTIFVWNIQSKVIEQQYIMPTNYYILNSNGKKHAHKKLFNFKNYIVATPFLGNGIIKIDKESQFIEYIANAFFSDILESVNGYNMRENGVTGFAKKVNDDTLLVQYKNGVLLEIDVNTGKYRTHFPKLSLETLNDLKQESDGFEKVYDNSEFARRESEIYDLDGFLEDLSTDKLDQTLTRQEEALDNMAVNLDGTCGEKIHKFMMSVLEE